MPKPTCSFCDRTSEDELLFEGDTRGRRTAYICRQCVRTFADMLMASGYESGCPCEVHEGGEPYLIIHH